MIALAWIALLAASTRVELVNEDYRIAAADWQWVPIGLKQQPGMIAAHFQVQSATGQVRLVLMRRQDLDDMPHGSLAQTEPARVGNLGHYIHDLGDYALVVDNRDGPVPADVHLTVWVDFSQHRTPVQTLSPQRQLTVILLSFAVFFGIAGWSARRLLRAVKK
jgi:hypothetical protein